MHNCTSELEAARGIEPRYGDLQSPFRSVEHGQDDAPDTCTTNLRRAEKSRALLVRRRSDSRIWSCIGTVPALVDRRSQYATSSMCSSSPRMRSAARCARPAAHTTALGSSGIARFHPGDVGGGVVEHVRRLDAGRSGHHRRAHLATTLATFCLRTYPRYERPIRR